MKFTPRGEFPRQRPLLASPLVLLSGEELIITEFPRQRPLLASPLVLLSGEQLGFCGRGRYLIPTPGVIFDACGWAWTFSSSPRATRSAAVLHQHHDEVLKPIVTSFPWVSLLHDLADVLPEGIDFVASMGENPRSNSERG